MEALKNTSPSHQLDREAAAMEARIRTSGDARRALASLLDDERELNQSAAEFFKLGNNIAGRDASPEERETLFHSYYQRILHHGAAREGTTEARREAVNDTLEEMRADNLRRHSTFEAHRAHVEIESFNEERDDLRALYNAPEDRTRAEHAGHLHAVSQDARDAYERGATVYGDVLVIPREAVGKPTNTDQIRVGSREHAALEFTPLVGEERAKEVAAEFVELGRQIAGRTADGDTHLIIFRTFYHEITLDPATGKFRPRDEQAAQIKPTLERMRVLADAMRAAEWKRDRAELVEFSEWERGGEDRQRDAEHEAHGRLTYRIENIPGLTPEHDELEEPSRERAEDERDAIGRISSVEYERVRLTTLPPRLPDGLSERDERRLRYEIIPRIDRQLETGARPRDISKRLYTEQRAEAERSRDERAARLIEARSPDANSEHPLTRAEELRALYTLQTLSAESERIKFDEEIARLVPSERERAEAIEVVGARLAHEYRRTTARLGAYEAAETERERLTGEALGYESTRRASAEFQLSLQQEREEERERAITEREALIRSNNARYQTAAAQQQRTSNYPELTGEPRSLSAFAQLRHDHTSERARARADIAAQLTSPDIEKAKSANLAVLEEHREYFRRAAGSEITNAKDARAALVPRMGLMRAPLDRLHAERSQIEIERSRPREQFSNPVFVGVKDGSLRLPVENFNEYKTLTKLAGKLKLNTRVYESQYGGEITGGRAERDAVYTFARDYLSYRAQDDVTRLRNEKRLFREYGARLDRARTIEELRAEVNDIRRDNYARATRPEQFADEGRDAVSRGEQPLRPLSTLEMRHLLLLPAPEHYTAEMRELRASRAERARDRRERISELESGARKPSPELAVLLREFDRTKHDSPERYSRNIKAFLGDYMNPPDPNRNRFSPENLYELGRRLPNAERDYLFRVVDSTKRALLAGVPVRESEGSSRLTHSPELDDRASSPSRNAAKDLRLARPMRDSSTSFRLYYGAATWREAGQLAEAAHRSAGEKPLSREHETIVPGIRDHDLETVAALLVESASKPQRVEDAAAFLHASQAPERRQLGEILQTFRAMKVSHDQVAGQLHFQITTPANSELGRDEWTRLLDHLPSRVNAARGMRLPEAQRGEIRRTALRLAWSDVESIGRQYAGLPSGEQVPGRADDFHAAIERGMNSQKRARTAADAHEQADAQDQKRRASLTDYAARTKSEYLESFREIDEQLDALSQRARRARVIEGQEAFSPVRDEMKTKVAAYLTDVVRAHGTDSLERNAAHHTIAVSRVIKETLNEHGYDLAALNLDDERVNSVTGKLVGELPGAIREDREQTRAHTHQLVDIARRDQMSPNREMEHATAATAALYDQASHNHGNSSSPRHAERLRHPDDEFVEQEVNRTIGQTHEQAPSIMPTSYTLEHHHHLPQHKAAPAHGADAREQHTHRYVLTR